MSTMIWQGRLHGVLAATGYDEKGRKAADPNQLDSDAGSSGAGGPCAVSRVPRRVRCSGERLAEALFERSVGSQ